MRKDRLKLVMKRGLAPLAVLLFLGAGAAVYMEEQGNFHSITPGEAYRSAQLDRDELEYYVRKYHIKSILNLQGARGPDDRHYSDEITVCRELGLAHYDLELCADEKPSKNETDQLIHIFKVVPRPILIHCKAGADRTGLAAALWKVIVDGEPKSLAARQLSIRYFHLPIGAATAMDEFFEEWQPEL
jgi:protein tyrosine/serine phosphatase